MTINLDDFVPACYNCKKWRHYKRGWGRCSSKQFRLSNGGEIFTKKQFQCIDYDTILSTTEELEYTNEAEDEDTNCSDSQLEKKQKAKITGIFC